MIDKSEVLHNVKVGSDTDLYVARINTKRGSANFTKIQTHAGGFDFPYLTRTTGNSLKPSTEFIQSNELRHGGAESAPRPGNTSVDGSIDVELSPNTFDDNICSAFNEEWKVWKGDSDSVTNLDGIPCPEGKFLTRACKQGAGTLTGGDVVNGYLYNGAFYEEDTHTTEIAGDADKIYVDLSTDEKLHYLWRNSVYIPEIDEQNYNNDEAFKPRRLLNDGAAGHEDGILIVPEGCVVNEMAFGSKNIEYLIAKKYGGVEGEDLYHIFKRLTVGTLDLNAQIGQIVTGSFGFMGDSSSDILETDEVKTYLGGATADKFEDGVTTGESFIDNLPEKATDTDQFTSREGDLWINGKNITFGQTLSLNIDKNLEKKYALFVKNPIAKTSLKKAITLNLETYLVPDSKVLYNLANNNKTFEVLFAFEDKGYMNDSFKDEDKPEFIYLFQVFNSKAEDKDLSASGESDYNMTIPLRSFGEKLCRVFKIALPKLIKSKAFDLTGGDKAVVFTPNVLLDKDTFTVNSLYDASSNVNGLKITVKVDDVEQSFSPVIGYEVLDGGEVKIVDANGDDVSATANVILDLVEDGSVTDTYGQIYVIPPAVTAGATDKTVEVNAKWHGKDSSCFYTVEHV